MPRIAVIGAGISGLSAAWHLSTPGSQTEVTLWGDDWPADLGAVDSVEHRLSVAARAFNRLIFRATDSLLCPSTCPSS